MDERKEGTGGGMPAVGGSSLLVIFAVLCLTVFALLSVSTVRADARLSEASAESVAAYYAADLAAQEILARVLAGEEPEGVEFDLDVCRYSCAVTEERELAVEVELDGLGGWRVLRWQVVSTGGWEPDEGLGLWDGEAFS